MRNGHNLTAPHHIAFVGTKFENTASEFRCDIDRVRLDTPIAENDAGRQGRLMMCPPIRPFTGRKSDDGEDHGNLPPPGYASA